MPLFAAPRSVSWGIGDIGDLPSLTAWLAGAGQRVLQLLPLNEMARGQQSPYSAMSAMAIDPIYIDMAAVPEFAALGGERALAEADRERLAGARASASVDYATVRALKHRALQMAFGRLLSDRARQRELAAFAERESWWLRDYALYRALHERESHRPWTAWPRPLQARDRDALAEAGRELAHEILFHEFQQWLADTQWRYAREAAAANGVALFGDLPFMVDGDSADVWAHQDEFHLDRSVGVPPDAFSATGQDWGMPAYRWDVIAARGFPWLRLRARRSAALFDGYRVDHLVGFYRTYSRPRLGGDAAFEPVEEAAQVALGEQNLAVFREPGAEIIAEDLGIVPEFVRASLARLGAPGFKIVRWEREWEAAGQPFRDPATYPPVSVAASGTHDTETVRAWWERSPEDERRALALVASAGRLRLADALTAATFTPAVRDALIELLLASSSALALMPIQDLFGWAERINEPGTVTPHNWTYRLPWAVDRLADEPEARERQAALRTLTARHGR